MAKFRKTVNKKLLLNEIDVYCCELSEYFIKDKTRADKISPKISALIDLMVFYFGENREELVDYAREQLDDFAEFCGEYKCCKGYDSSYAFNYEF